MTCFARSVQWPLGANRKQRSGAPPRVCLDPHGSMLHSKHQQKKNATQVASLRDLETCSGGGRQYETVLADSRAADVGVCADWAVAAAKQSMEHPGPQARPACWSLSAT